MKGKSITLITIVTIIIVGIVVFLVQKNQQKSREYEIEKISEYKYFVVKENEKYGVIDVQGNTKVEIKYENVKIPNPEKDVFICYEGDSTKVLNEKNEEIFTQYKNIEPLRLRNISGDLIYEKSTLKYNKDGKYGIINFEGKELTKPIYEEIDTLEYKEGELIVKKDGKYGVININGTVLVKEEYDKIETDKYYDSELGYKKAGYIVSNTTDEGYRYGYINVKGKKITDIIYNDLHRISEVGNKDIYLICAENGKYGLLKNSDKIIENDYQSLVFNESNNTIIALKGRKYGVISMEGKIIIPFEYNQIDSTGQYIYATDLEGRIRIFDLSGKETEMNENIAIINVPNTNYQIYIETTDGETKYSIFENNVKNTQNEYTYIQYLFDDYFIASNTKGELGVIDNKENIKIEFKYNSIQRIENTTMIQTLENNTKNVEIYSKELKKISELKNGAIDNNNDYIKLYNDEEMKYISNEEKEVPNTEIFPENQIFASKKGTKWGFIDKTGNIIIDYKYDKVTEQNLYGFAGICIDGKWGIVNKEGKTIVEPKYELNDNYPIFIGEYYQVIYGNGEKYFTK